MTDCVLSICDGSGLLDVTDWTGGEQQRCPCGQATEPPPDLHARIMGAIREGLAEARIAAGLRLAATLEAEARYGYTDHRVDVGMVAHRIRVALGLVQSNSGDQP